MSRHLRSHVVGYVAVFIALGGTAAALPGKNKVDSGDIKAGEVKEADLATAAVTNPKLAPNAVDGSKVADNALKGADVDESSLDIPQQALPTTLPPSGAAGGDLAGSYPDPQVQETGLAPGGDLSGTLANAQVGEGGLGAGGDLTGTVANAQIGSGAVGDAEIADGETVVDIPAGEVGPAALAPASAPDLGAINGFPVLNFDSVASEQLDLVVRVPERLPPSPDVFVAPEFAAASGTGTGRFESSMARVRPSADNLNSPVAVASQNSVAVSFSAANHGQVFSIGGGGSASIQTGDLLRIRLVRDPANAGDTLNADLALLGVTVDFTTRR